MVSFQLTPEQQDLRASVAQFAKEVAGKETLLHTPLECQCDVIPTSCPPEPGGHLHHLVRNRGRACRGCGEASGMPGR